ncbi:hypothetical protein KFU94_00775 [Chloroflexi bacterium TSY]|nr:hypothetical protein [Chloroflexi bacterium TSY]
MSEINLTKPVKTVSIIIAEMPNFVRIRRASLNGTVTYRLEVKRTADGKALFRYPDISTSCRRRAEELAAEYAILKEIPLLLDNDDDGLFADLLMQQAYERSLSNELSTLWMT